MADGSKGRWAARLGIAAGVAAGVFAVTGMALSWPLLLAGGLAAGGFGGGYLLSRPLTAGTSSRPRALPGTGGRVPVTNLGSAKRLPATLDGAQRAMETLRRATRSLLPGPLRDEAHQLERSGERLLDYLSERPERIPAARRFMDYYLETAHETLERYLAVEASRIEGHEADAIREATARALPLLNESFERQFARLMAGDLLEIETDLHLLETTARAEGIDIPDGDEDADVTDSIPPKTGN